MSLSFAVIIVSSRRPKLLARCLDSFLKANIDPVAIYVLLHGGPRADEEFFKSNSSYQKINFFFHETLLGPGAARNWLFEKVQADWCYFIDDDAYIKNNLFQRAIELIQNKKDLVMLGGPNLTPELSNHLQACSGIVLSHWYGTLGSAARYKSLGVSRLAQEKELTSCNLFIRTDILKKFKYSEDLLTAEESYLIAKILKHYPSQSYYDPSLEVGHERRSDFLGFAFQIFRYAMGRAALIKKNKFQTLWIYFVPSVFLIIFIASSLFSFELGLLMLLFYLVVTAFISSSLKLNCQKQITVFILFIVLHLMYSLGFIWGLGSGFGRRKIKV